VDSEIRGKDVYFVQPCGTPVSDNIVEILLMVSAARRSGAKRVTAVIPYFPFKHRRKGTTSSAKYRSRFLSSAAMDFAIMLQEVGVDRVVAVDLQRPGQGQEACFFDNSVPLEVVLTKGLMIKYFAENIKFDADRPIIIVSPNTECLKRAMKFTSGLKKSLDRKDVSLIGFMQLGTGTGSQDDKLLLEPLGEANVRLYESHIYPLFSLAIFTQDLSLFLSGFQRRCDNC
jgi:ribose-phosphate pyrophosphokinase